MSIDDLIWEAVDRMAFLGAEYSAPGGAEGEVGDRLAAGLADASARFWYGWRAIHPVVSDPERQRHWLALAMDALGEAVGRLRAAQRKHFNPILPRPAEDIEAERAACHEVARAAAALLAQIPGPRQLVESL